MKLDIIFFIFFFRLESPTRSLEVKGPQGVAIESRAGDISASCLTDLKLQSLAGAVNNQSFFFLRRFFISNFP